MRHAALLQTALFIAVIAIASIAAGAGALSFKRPSDSDLVSGRLAKSFEKHYDESFPFKRFGVNLWTAIDLALFGEGRPGIVIGQEHWLYTAEEFNVADDSETELRNNLALIEWIKAQLATRHVALLIAVVPAKARVYPEYAGAHKPPRLQRELHHRLIAALTAQRIATADLLPTLTAAKAQQPTYLRTDTHWTPWGAQHAAARIADLAKARGFARAADARTRYVTTRLPEQPHHGDLLNFLPLEPWFAALLPPPDRIRVPVTAAVPAEDAGATVDLFGNASLPQVVLIGTSYSVNPAWNFAGALKEALGEDLANLAKEGVGPFPPMVRYLLGEGLRQTPPRLVIWEMPERALIVKPDLQAFALPPEALDPQRPQTQSSFVGIR